MTRAYKGFDDALLFGERAQDRVADILRAAGGFANKKDGRERYDFELHFNNHVYRVEVKNEDRYCGSGNICVETRQGRPLRLSGIAFSEAQVFVHTLGENAALYRRRDMHLWLQQEARAGRRFEQSFGDNNNKGFVIPVGDLDEFDWFQFLPLNWIGKSKLWMY